MDLNPDFRDMLHAMNDAKADFLAVGAYAVAAHGHPRATGDLDNWVRADVDNASKVIAALSAFGARMDQSSEQDFASPSIVFQIGIPPGRIDMLTDVSGVDFGTAWDSRMSITIDDITVPFLGRAELVANTRASGRPKDLADLDALGE